MKFARIGPLLVLALLLLPDSAVAQRETWPAGLRGDVTAALQSELRRAESAGLPGRALILKALEGRSKGATDEQILKAVVALHERLAVAAEIFGTDHGEDVLLAAAAAMHAGVGRNALRTLSTTTRQDALDMALVVVGDLIRRGVPTETATQAVLSLGEAGVDALVLNEVRRSVDDDIRTGLTPAHATEVRLRGVLMRGGGSGVR
jgi:hypothetical protein